LASLRHRSQSLLRQVRVLTVQQPRRRLHSFDVSIPSSSGPRSNDAVTGLGHTVPVSIPSSSGPRSNQTLGGLSSTKTWSQSLLRQVRVLTQGCRRACPIEGSQSLLRQVRVLTTRRYLPEY